MLLASACGGGSDDADAETATAAGNATAAKSLAALVIIDRDTSVRPVGVTAFRGGTEGEGLGVGDTIQTSATGFAEVAYFDGSLTRVDRSGEFTLTTLDNTTGARRVEGSLVGGRAWNRVTKATGSPDQFEIDTPVATAAVRGTAFSIDCTATDACTFTIVEGTVEITPLGGTPITVTAPARLTIQRNTTPPRPTVIDNATIAADPWITKNTTRDISVGKAPATTTSSTTTSTSTTTTLPAPTTTAQAPATTNPPPPTTVPPPPRVADLTGEWVASIVDPYVVTSSGITGITSLGLEGEFLWVRFTTPNGTGGSGRLVSIGRVQIAASGDGYRASGKLIFLFRPLGPRTFSAQTDARDGCPGSQTVAGVGIAQLSADGSTLQSVNTRTTILQANATGRDDCNLGFVQIAWTEVLTKVG